MRDKYNVRYHGKTKRFKTKQEIMNHFQCPLYIIDKIIRKESEEGNVMHITANCIKM